MVMQGGWVDVELSRAGGWARGSEEYGEDLKELGEIAEGKL